MNLHVLASIKLPALAAVSALVFSACASAPTPPRSRSARTAATRRTPTPRMPPPPPAAPAEPAALPVLRSFALALPGIALTFSRSRVRSSAHHSLKSSQSVKLTLRKNNLVTVTDTGQRSSGSHQRNPRIVSSSRTRWDVSWKGWWTLRADRLHLSLKLVSGSGFQQVSTRGRGKPTHRKTVFRDFPTFRAILCTFHMVTPAGGGSATAQLRCVLTGRQKPYVETAFPWVFRMKLRPGPLVRGKHALEQKYYIEPE